MKTLNDYLDLYKEKNNIESDYKLAKTLNVTRASISIIRSGGGVSQKTAVKLSEGTKEPLEVIWLASLAQKEQNPVFKEALENISKLSGLAASFFIIFQSTTLFSLMLEIQECILC